MDLIFGIYFLSKIWYPIHRKKKEVIDLHPHIKKMIPPIVVTVLLVLYYLAYFVLLLEMVEGVWKYLLGILPLALAAMIIYVCIQRIFEIKKGEEDDLSQY